MDEVQEKIGRVNHGPAFFVAEYQIEMRKDTS
jgi:hypothetical protein